MKSFKSYMLANSSETQFLPIPGAMQKPDSLLEIIF